MAATYGASKADLITTDNVAVLVRNSTSPLTQQCTIPLMLNSHDTYRNEDGTMAM